MIETHGDIKVYRIPYPHTDELYAKVRDKIRHVTSQPSYMPFTNTIISAEAVATNKAARCSFWNADGKGIELYKWDELSEFFAFVKPHIRNYLNEIGIDEKDIVIKNVWCNEYPQGTSTNRHRHLYSDYGTAKHIHKTPYDIIGVLFYIHKPKDSADLLLEIDGEMKKMNVQPGEILILPTYQYHTTEPYVGDDFKHMIGIELLPRWITDEEIVGMTLEEL